MKEDDYEEDPIPKDVEELIEDLKNICPDILYRIEEKGKVYTNMEEKK